MGAKYDFDYEEFEEVSADAKDFITRLLRKNANKRMNAAACLEHSWLKEKLMRRKTARIKVTNLRKFLARRKVQNIGRALKVINVLKTAARQSRGSLEGSLDSESFESEDDNSDSRSFSTMTDSEAFSSKDENEHDLESIMNEALADNEESSTNKSNSELENQNESLVGSVNSSSDTSDVENCIKDNQVKRVNFDSGENKIRNYHQSTSDEHSEDEEFIAAFNESQDEINEELPKFKKDNKNPGLRRTASRAAPGTVKRLMARFENNS